MGWGVGGWGVGGWEEGGYQDRAGLAYPMGATNGLEIHLKGREGGGVQS